MSSFDYPDRDPLAPVLAFMREHDVRLPYARLAQWHVLRGQFSHPLFGTVHAGGITDGVEAYAMTAVGLRHLSLGQCTRDTPPRQTADGGEGDFSTRAPRSRKPRLLSAEALDDMV